MEVLDVSVVFEIFVLEVGEVIIMVVVVMLMMSVWDKVKM